MVWNEQFQQKKFKFMYDSPEEIVLCRWQTNTRTTTAYLLYRMGFVTFFLGTEYFAFRMALRKMACSSFHKIDKGSLLAYYTTWTEILCTLAAISSFFITANQYIRDEDYLEERRDNVYECRKWYRMHMVLYTLALDSSVALGFGYFGYVYFNEKKNYRGISFAIHLWSGILMLLDFTLSSMPTNLLYFYVDLCLSFTYGLFSWIYYILGGKNVIGQHCLYKLLNWKDHPWLAAFAVLAGSVFFVGVRFVVFIVSLIRDSMFYKYYYLGSDSASANIS